MDRRRRLVEELGQARTPLAERDVTQVLVALGEEVEGDEPGRRLLAEHRDTGLGRVDALAERVERQGAVDGHDDLPVDHATVRQGHPQRLEELGEVAGQRLAAAGLEHHLVPVAEDDAAVAVPLRLEQPAGARGQPLRVPREHRLEPELDRQRHAVLPAGTRAKQTA